MRTFDSDDDGYLVWVDANPDGFVVNSSRKPRPNYLILHRAACKSISRTAPEPIRWTSGDYIKTCSVDLGALERWARDTVGSPLSPCEKCDPV